MKALYAQQNSPGEEITFVFQERENLPACRAHDVKVQVRACALSWLDTKLLSEIQLKKELVPVGREISGVVLEVGSKVTFFQPDDEVVGILPLDSEESGVCEVILVHEHYLAIWYHCNSAGPTQRGQSHLHCPQPGGQAVPGEAQTCWGSLAAFGGASCCCPALAARVMDVSHGKIDVAESCLEETGGLGVDVVLDAGVRLYSAEDEAASKCQLLPHKHDIITLLGVGGRWITTERNLQLDPPDSHSLFLKGATVSFLNDEVWNLSSVQQGKYLAILEDIMEKLSNGIFRPQLDEPIPLYEAKVTMEIVQKNQARKRQVIQF
ncbi:quinone oxidoreductase-like protein 1 isoform X2 [Onychostruthus taczanowskii]|uniref:quinone oxidoreductase-like protein 1 isoform X2 n=1 Tax=Onychostruthus taczanowskii TaxID=356909 RepID=UPI001B7FFFCC|nr:quinone oxidoreductase-like protein 1 isoform X2 [Onychostruthus taczanowskii]